MSMSKLDKPLRMTVEEANKEFYPNTYLMVNCEMDLGAAIAGEVIAYAPLKKQATLVDYAWELEAKGTHGEVSVFDTKDPLDGEALLVEYDTSE